LEAAIEDRIKLWGCFLPPGTKVLDLGCGQQPYRPIVEKQLFHYSSFDVVQNQDSSVDFLGRIDDLDLPEKLLNNGPYDLIMVTEVMEHVLDWDRAFGNLQRLVSPKGEILITCPFFFPIHEEPFDFWRPTYFTLAAFSKKYNFEIKTSDRLGSATDCLGLIVGHLLVRMNYKTPTNLIQRVRFSLQQRLIKGILKSLHWLITKGVFENYFNATQDLYVSNLVVLRGQIKP
jgi:ubiquinone/menaquinone biosynthesis C-methylase UbiE